MCSLSRVTARLVSLSRVDGCARPPSPRSPRDILMWSPPSPPIWTSPIFRHHLDVPKRPIWTSPKDPPNLASKWAVSGQKKSIRAPQAAKRRFPGADPHVIQPGCGAWGGPGAPPCRCENLITWGGLGNYGIHKIGNIITRGWGVVTQSRKMRIP